MIAAPVITAANRVGADSVEIEMDMPHSEQVEPDYLEVNFFNTSAMGHGNLDLTVGILSEPSSFFKLL